MRGDEAHRAAGPDVLHHAWQVDEREYARHEARRGRRHAYERLDPRRTALVVVDLVPFFVRESPYVRGIVPQVNVLARGFRDAGGHVAWVVPGYREPTAKEREFFGDEVAERYACSGGVGDPAARVDPSLLVAPGDLAVEKTDRGAWSPGSSNLPGLLDERGVDTVVVTGTVTNVCVEDTVRGASTAGLRTILVADGCAATRDADHNATLHVVYRSYGDVRTTADVLSMLAAGR